MKDISCYLFPDGSNFYSNTGWGEFQLFRYFEIEEDQIDIYDWAEENKAIVDVEIFDFRQSSEIEIQRIKRRLDRTAYQPWGDNFLSIGMPILADLRLGGE